jgi:hypothetical protein
VHRHSNRTTSDNEDRKIIAREQGSNYKAIDRETIAINNNEASAKIGSATMVPEGWHKQFNG